MAQTKKKRRKKHRGTQGGGIDRRGRGRPRTREEARAQAKRRSEYRKKDAAPTWRGAITRALIGAIVFFGLTVLLFNKSVGQSLILAVVMLVIYIPLGYQIDRFFYRRRRSKEIAERQAQKQARRGR